MEAPRRTAAGGRGQERCTVYAGCVLGGPERAQRIGLCKLFLDGPRAAQTDEIDPHRQTRSTRTGRRNRPWPLAQPPLAIYCEGLVADVPGLGEGPAGAEGLGAQQSQRSAEQCGKLRAGLMFAFTMRCGDPGLGEAPGAPIPQCRSTCL